MSLEQQIMDLIDALDRNTAALTGRCTFDSDGFQPDVIVTPPGATIAPDFPPPKKKRRTKKEVAAAKALDAEQKERDALPPVEPPEPKPDATLSDVREALKLLVQIKGRDAAVTLLGELDATKTSELDESNYRTFIDRCGNA